MTLINNFDIHQDFYTSNPQAAVLLKEFSSTPSSHMWALFLFAHPNSKFFDISTDERKRIIHHDYLDDDPSFDWVYYQPLIEFIQQKILSKAERSLMIWEKELHDLETFLSSLSYSEDTFEAKIKIISSLPKLWDSFESIQDRLTKEKLSKTHGDIEESLTEKGEI